LLRSIGKQSGESVESVLKKKKTLRWEGFAEKVRVKVQILIDNHHAYAYAW